MCYGLGMKDATNPRPPKRGFTKASGLLRDPIAAAAETRGFSQSRLITNWAETVGTDLAKIAQPVKITYGKQSIGAKLTLLVSGANAPMLQMQVPIILERVNAVYGFNAIHSIHLTQTATSGFSETPVPKTDPTKLLPAETRNEIETLVEPVADSGLKEALNLLGQNIATKRKQKVK